jgi:hypothetical protein
MNKINTPGTIGQVDELFRKRDKSILVIKRVTFKVIILEVIKKDLRFHCRNSENGQGQKVNFVHSKEIKVNKKEGIHKV